MSSENKTPNIGLNQWQGNEYVRREDFVNDNLIIDSEIKDLQAKTDEKVDKVSGKGLSTEDYTTEEKHKLSNIQEGANKYVHPNKHSLDMITETSGKKIMTTIERNKLSSIENNANNYVHPTTHSLNEITETSTKKIMTSDERNKLSGIQSGAQVNRVISSSVSSTSTSTTASSKAVKTAYDKAVSALNTANTKETAFSKKTGFNLNKSDSVSSTSTSTLATSKAVKTAYDRGVQALNVANTKENAFNKNSGFNKAKSDSVTSTSSNTLATSKAVKTINDKAIINTSDIDILKNEITSLEMMMYYDGMIDGGKISNPLALAFDGFFNDLYIDKSKTNSTYTIRGGRYEGCINNRTSAQEFEGAHTSEGLPKISTTSDTSLRSLSSSSGGDDYSEVTDGDLQKITIMKTRVFDNHRPTGIYVITPRIDRGIYRNYSRYRIVFKMLENYNTQVRFSHSLYGDEETGPNHTIRATNTPPVNQLITWTGNFPDTTRYNRYYFTLVTLGYPQNDYIDRMHLYSLDFYTTASGAWNGVRKTFESITRQLHVSFSKAQAIVVANKPNFELYISSNGGTNWTKATVKSTRAWSEDSMRTEYFFNTTSLSTSGNKLKVKIVLDPTNADDFVKVLNYAIFVSN